MVSATVARLSLRRIKNGIVVSRIFKLSRRQAHRIIAEASGEALGRRVSAHWLRHAHCSHALDHGAPLHLVRESLGHSRLSTTLRYAHARPTESSGAYLPLCAG
jgi:integrase/recombinase XerD